MCARRALPARAVPLGLWGARLSIGPGSRIFERLGGVQAGEVERLSGSTTRWRLRRGEPKVSPHFWHS